MAGSLKTANYELSKYAPNDITSWLVDFNGNMDKIDAQMKKNADANVGTSGEVSALTQRVAAAEGNITSLTDDVTALKEETVITPLAITNSSNVSVSHNLIFMLGDLIGIGFTNTTINKETTALSTIDIGDSNKFIPLLNFSGNPFNLPTATSPTANDLKICGSGVIKLQASGKVSLPLTPFYMYFNGVNTLYGVILSESSITSGTNLVTTMANFARNVLS